MLHSREAAAGQETPPADSAQILKTSPEIIPCRNFKEGICPGLCGIDGNEASHFHFSWTKTKKTQKFRSSGKRIVSSSKYRILPVFSRGLAAIPNGGAAHGPKERTEGLSEKKIFMKNSFENRGSVVLSVAAAPEVATSPLPAGIGDCRHSQ